MCDQRGRHHRVSLPAGEGDGMPVVSAVLSLRFFQCYFDIPFLFACSTMGIESKEDVIELSTRRRRMLEEAFILFTKIVTQIISVP